MVYFRVNLKKMNDFVLEIHEADEAINEAFKEGGPS